MSPSRPALLLLPLLLASCQPAGDSAESAPVDSAPPWPRLGARLGLPPWPAASDLSAELHPDFGSLVWARWQQLAQCSGRVEYSFDEGEWLASPQRALEEGPQEQLLLGVPYEADLRLRVVSLCDGLLHRSAELELSTAELPVGVEVPAVLSSEPDLQDPSLRFLLTSSVQVGWAGNPERAWTVILDRQGRVVWALVSPYFRLTLHPRLARDGGSLLLDRNSFWGLYDQGAASQVLRVGIDGTELAWYDTPGLHHGFVDLPDGGLAWGAVDGEHETLELLSAEGEQRSLWSCRSFHEQLGESAACASNAVDHSEDRGSFLLSFYTTHSVVEIGAEHGETRRWFGHLDGAWSFEPEESAFWWQHGAHLTAAGTLLLSTHDSPEGSELVAREYELDEENEQLHQIWSFGEGQGVFGEYMGEALRLEGGNTLHNYGTALRVREATAAGELAWELGWEETYWLGRSEPIEDLYALLP